MAAADPFADLARELDLAVLHLKQMLALLELERHELVASGGAGLEAITAERLVQVKALELYAARRAALLEGQGFGADAAGLAACVAAAGERGLGLAARWRQVAEAMAKVRDLNARNRALMRTLLAALGGVAGVEAPGCEH
jgi:flagellar biosynthesis/type III secretory pathway chaperone